MTTTRRVILFMHLSLDGHVATPQHRDRMDWVTMDPEVGSALVPELLADVDTMLLGRTLFEGFEQAWPAMAEDPEMPKEIVDFARWIEDSPKIVFSTTLESVGWKNARLVRVRSDDDVAAEVERLKREPGKAMVVFGGARLAQTLAARGLIDEYRIKLEPVVLGEGRPLFKDVVDTRRLKLVRSRTFASGVLGLYYRPAAPGA